MENKFPDTLGFLMKKFDVSDEKLGAMLDVNRTTVTRWRKGIRSPKLDKLPEIAQIFQVEPRCFVSGDLLHGYKNINKIYDRLSPDRQDNVYVYASNQLEEQNSNVSDLAQERAKRQREFPWCGAASAGAGEFLMEDQHEMVLIDEDMIPADADFCLTVNGDSMEPIFPDQSYIFIKKQCELRSGEIGVVIVDDEAFIKRVWYDDDHAKLESFNKKYDDRVVDRSANFKVVGKVVL